MCFAGIVATLLLVSSPAPDRLTIRDVRLGHGKRAKPGDVLILSYTATVDGGGLQETQGKLYAFVMGEHAVVRAWDEGLAGMKAGGVRELVSPPSFAYGSQGLPPRIPPNATMKFVVNLVSLQRIRCATVRAGHGLPAKRGDSINVEMAAAASLKDLALSGSSAKNEYAIRLGTTVIPDGLTDGLIGIRAGEVRHIYIPYALAIQMTGVEKVLPKGAPMIYEVHALALQPS
jgi:FKBP-type peptidyl-prolyl cis-trans isomerase